MSQAATDAELLGAFFADEDDNAFRQIVERHSAMVHRACLHGLNGDEALAKDACQAVFVLLIRKGRSLRKRQALAAWLRRTASSVVKNLVREHSRRRKREQTAVELQAADAPEASEGESREKLLLQAIGELPQKYREPLELHYLDGRKLREVGEALGCSEDAARKRVKASLQKLRRAMKESGAVLTLAVLLGMLAKLVGVDRVAGVVQLSHQAAMEAAGHAAGSLASLPSHLIAEGVEAMWLQRRVRTVIAAATALLALGIIPLAILHARPRRDQDVAPIAGGDPLQAASTHPKPITQPGTGSGSQAVEPVKGKGIEPTLLKPVAEPDILVIFRDEFTDAGNWVGYRGSMRRRGIITPKEEMGLTVNAVDFNGNQVQALDIDCAKLGGDFLTVVCDRRIAEDDYRIDFDLRQVAVYPGKGAHGFSLGAFTRPSGGGSTPKNNQLNPNVDNGKTAATQKWFHVEIEVHFLDSADSRAAVRYDIFVNGIWYQTAYYHDLPNPKLSLLIVAGVRLQLANFQVRRIAPLPPEGRKIPLPE